MGETEADLNATSVLRASRCRDESASAVDTDRVHGDRQFPTILGDNNVVILGGTLQSRTCALRGVVRFTSIEGQAVAQLDPNLRDTTGLWTPVCFPIASMIFFAGLVDSDADSAFERSIAVQVEPHGRLRVIGGLTTAEAENGVLVRLDGVAFHPFMPFNTVPSCEPYCFGIPDMVEGKRAMGNSGCVKYCAPTQYNMTMRPPALVNCQCDMVKRLECWFHRDDAKRLRCGQFKQLLATRPLDKLRPTPDCEIICSQQLSSL